MWTAIVIYTLGVAYFTLFWRTGSFEYGYNMRLNIIPFYWLWEPLKNGGDVIMSQVLLNVLLFIPLGMLQPMIQSSHNMKKTFVIALIATCSIELIQPLFGRCTDVDDVILNVGGAILGYIFFIVFTKVKKASRIKNHLYSVEVQSIYTNMDRAA